MACIHQIHKGAGIPGREARLCWTGRWTALPWEVVGTTASQWAPTGHTRQREGRKAGRVGPLWRAMEARQRLGISSGSRGSASELWDNAVRFVSEQDSERAGGIWQPRRGRAGGERNCGREAVKLSSRQTMRV